MALFACKAGRNQAVAFHGRFNRTRETVENHVDELVRARHFTLQPPSRARSHVAIHAKDIRMRRILMCRELRFHHMATLAAELGSFHVLYGTIGALCSDHDIDRGSYNKEYCESSKVSCPIRSR